MSTRPWDNPSPKKTGRTKLTPLSIARARDAAKKAGRPYPNLIDNMNAARQQREQDGDDKASP